MELKWRYCVVGNIVKTHVDENGILRYGTSAFTGSTKVYLCGKYWDQEWPEIGVIGLSRAKRFIDTAVPVSLIENVRVSKAYKPSVMEMMNYFEFSDDWWYNQPEDKEAVMQFVAEWNRQFCTPPCSHDPCDSGCR